MGRKRRNHVLRLKKERELREGETKKQTQRPVESPRIDLKVEPPKPPVVKEEIPSRPKTEAVKPKLKTTRQKTTKKTTEKKPRTRRTTKKTTLSAAEKKPTRRRRTTKKVVEKTDDQ